MPMPHRRALVSTFAFLSFVRVVVGSGGIDLFAPQMVSISKVSREGASRGLAGAGGKVRVFNLFH